MSNATTATSSLVLDLQVSGSKSYEGHQWREAILAYLGGVWSGDESVTSRQKLNFNNTTLRLGRDDKYYAYFVLEPDASPLSIVAKNTSELLVVSEPNQDNVEVGLMRFVRDNHIRQLYIAFGESTSPEMAIVLTKGQKRSELHIATCGLASMSDVMRRLGYNV